jgi:cysteine desulfurase
MSKSISPRHGGARKSKKIYLDYASSVEPNPSSIHAVGVVAKTELQNARRAIAHVLHARTDEIIFTSGGTESNNLAIQGLIWGFKGHTLPHLITTNIEHSSVLETFKLLTERKLATISIVPVEGNGLVDPKKIKKEINENTVLVSVGYANNEIGVVQLIKEISKIIRHYKKQAEKQKGFPLLHTDAVQAVNYLDLNVDHLGVDLLTLSGSKIEGAGRVGVLFKRKDVPLARIFGGGDQEMGLRSGTENLPEILRFANALKDVEQIKEKESSRLVALRDYFLIKLQDISRTLLDIKLVINGDMENRLPNNLNITFGNIPSDLLVIELSARGIMTSAKSACKSAEAGGSYVVKAIHPEISGDVGGVRFSFGRGTTKKDIDYTIKALSEILNKLKKWYT